MISASFLSIKDNIKEKVKILDGVKIDYLHLDIMDGIFVPNKTMDIDKLENILDGTTTLKDIHLMVKDVKKYVEEYIIFNPSYITFHYEAVDNVVEMINFIKSFDINAGISIKPDTSINEIKKYLDIVDLVLVMSVEPGKGGQPFIEKSVSKINELKSLRDNKKYNYVIEVDGGINDITSKKCNNADILVVGSYITNSDNYEKQIRSLSN